ncbi:MAG: M23 family metallopeptidase [Candidatus Gracilibacteria bacterium]|jgi:murein DD-endopeptidase MepM/ murein hydrolase activator NlpD
MSTVNEEARKTRHKKFFSIYSASPVIGKLKNGISKAGRYLSSYTPVIIAPTIAFADPIEVTHTPKKFAKNMVLLTLAFFLITSFDIGRASVDGGEGMLTSFDEDILALNNDTNLLADQEGYLMKSMPMGGEPTYQLNRTEKVAYTVQSGDTLSLIAYRFGINQDSVMAANEMSNANYLKSGQDLEIPPRDGAYVEVKKDDTFDSLIEEYAGDAALTKEINEIGDDNAITVGDKIFIAGDEVAAKYIASIKPVYVASTASTYTGYNSSDVGTSYENVDVATVYASADFVYPTTGDFTQGYHSGHYAYDIADRSQPPIVAASSGTVITAAYGWNGGYGNYVIIDHLNGYKTLYGHMEELYVAEGESVAMGQAIGKMGNTGRVYGVTGIHLHFEISYNGTKFPACDVGICY